MSNKIIQIKDGQDNVSPYLSQTSTPSAFTIANANITNLERSIVKTYGKVVVVDLTFTVGTAITDYTAILFSGLPASYGTNARFRCFHSTDSSKCPLTLAVTTNGDIINQWSQGGLTTGQYACLFTYISQ